MEEELTFSTEGNQNLEREPDLYVTTSTSQSINDLQVEDDGTSSTIADEKENYTEEANEQNTEPVHEEKSSYVVLNLPELPEANDSPTQQAEQDPPPPTKQDALLPIEQDPPPPTKQDALLPIEQDPPPPTEQDALSPIEQNPPHPAEQDALSPIEQDPPPPAEQDALSPIEQDPPPPTKQDALSPIEQDPPPPAEQDTLSPIEQDPPPPTKQDALSPIEQDPSPPTEQDALSPIEQNPPPPAEQDALSPIEQNPPPPAEQDALSPIEQDPPPPAEQDTLSPIEQDPPPPAEQDALSPIEQNPPPPAEQDALSPIEQNPPPPAEQDTLSPIEQDPPPPAEQDTLLPMEQDLPLLAQQEDTPPPLSSSSDYMHTNGAETVRVTNKTLSYTQDHANDDAENVKIFNPNCDIEISVETTATAIAESSEMPCTTTNNKNSEWVMNNCTITISTTKEKLVVPPLHNTTYDVIDTHTCTQCTCIDLHQNTDTSWDPQESVDAIGPASPDLFINPPIYPGTRQKDGYEIVLPNENLSLITATAIAESPEMPCTATDHKNSEWVMTDHTIPKSLTKEELLAPFLHNSTHAHNLRQNTDTSWNPQKTTIVPASPDLFINPPIDPQVLQQLQEDIDETAMPNNNSFQTTGTAIAESSKMPCTGIDNKISEWVTTTKEGLVAPPLHNPIYNVTDTHTSTCTDLHQDTDTSWNPQESVDAIGPASPGLLINPPIDPGTRQKDGYEIVLPNENLSPITATAIAESSEIPCTATDHNNSEWVMTDHTITISTTKEGLVAPPLHNPIYDVTDTHTCTCMNPQESVDAIGPASPDLLINPPIDPGTRRQLQKYGKEIVLRNENLFPPLKDASEHSYDSF